MPEQQKARKKILDSVAGDIELRNKRRLIEKFIVSEMPNVESAAEIPDCFEEYWEQERVSAFDALCKEDNSMPTN